MQVNGPLEFSGMRHERRFLARWAAWITEKKGCTMTRTNARFLLLCALIIADAWLPRSAAGEPKDKSAKTPTLVIDVSASLVNAFVKRSIDRTDPVDVMMQEAQAKGTSRTVGAVTAELIPDTKKAIVEVVFRGELSSETTSTRPFVLVSTSSSTLLEVRRRIILDDKGMHSTAGGNFGKSAISLREIKARKEPEGIAVKLATELFRRNKGDAEFETATKAAWNTSSSLAKEISPTLAAISKAALQSSAGPKKAGLSVEALEFSSTASGLQGRLFFATPGRETKPCPPNSKGADLEVTLHKPLRKDAR